MWVWVLLWNMSIWGCFLPPQHFWALIFLEKAECWLRRVISVPSGTVKQIRMPSPHPRGAQACWAQRGAIWIFAERHSAGFGWVEDSMITKIKWPFWGLQWKERDDKVDLVETAILGLLTSSYRPLLSKLALKTEIFLTVQVYRHMFKISVLWDLFFLLYSELFPTKETMSAVFQKSQISLIILNSCVCQRLTNTCIIHRITEC